MKKDLLLEQFKLLNHNSELTKNLEIGKVYLLEPYPFKNKNGFKDAWILNHENINKHFSDEQIDEYFERVGTNIIGYGQTY